MSLTLDDLPLGPLEQHIATLPVDAKRIKGLTVSAPITGQVAGGATIDAGSGFTVASGGTGQYTITFTTAFTAAPTVVATAFDSSGSRVAHIVSVATTNVVIQTRQGGGTASNIAFHFVAFATV